MFYCPRITISAKIGVQNWLQQLKIGHKVMHTLLQEKDLFKNNHNVQSQSQ